MRNKKEYHQHPNNQDIKLITKLIKHHLYNLRKLKAIELKNLMKER